MTDSSKQKPKKDFTTNKNPRDIKKPSEVARTTSNASEKTPKSTKFVTYEPKKDQVHEFDVDVLGSWEQSSGTLSYNSARSLSSILNHGKGKSIKMLDLNALRQAKLNQRLIRNTMPPQKTLSAKALRNINEALRQEQIQGHSVNRIIVKSKQDTATERYELISKICNDAIREFMTSHNRNNKLLEIICECGGDLPPRTTINGIRAAPTIKLNGKNDCDMGLQTLIYKSKHPMNHLSTCSPALPYSSANTFSRCSIEKYVKILNQRWKFQKQQ
ncbi:unnamed protein product [Thelazia callipaeda]|uniref:Uncharacterized protein n=1 Tax=Thelazia callipaeda TaxID=103827 RepID=A0A0N5D0R0_THECL|nr:unnamed protein product [Thelazia callipaeda]